jgi:hypothetical protein
MVNEDVVNAKTLCLNHAHFCIYLLALGRFLLFKKPVKYKTMLAINQRNSALKRPLNGGAQLLCFINTLLDQTLNGYSRFFCYITSRSKDASSGLPRQALEAAGIVNMRLPKARERTDSEAIERIGYCALIPTCEPSFGRNKVRELLRARHGIAVGPKNACR